MLEAVVALVTLKVLALQGVVMDITILEDKLLQLLEHQTQVVAVVAVEILVTALAAMVALV